ncbi:MAG: tetratricopeptide repeat protein [Methyloligellaceae bacterium]
MRRALCFAFVLLACQLSLAAAAAEDTVLRVREGAANLLRGKYQDAIASFDSALKAGDLADVRRANILNDRGVAKWRLKRAKEAIEDFNTSVELFPDYAIVYNNRGNALMDLGEVEQAVLDFTRAIELAPKYGAAFNNRGNALLALDREEEAQKDFRKAIQLMPTNAVPYNGRGKAHAALGRPFAGVRDFSRALALNATYSGARENRGAAYLKLRRDNDAVRDYTELIAQKPESTQFYFARGSAYARTRRYNAAVKDFSKVISLDPDHTDAYRERGVALLKVKQLEKAREDLSMALLLDSDDVGALTRRAEVYARLRFPAEALADAEKALSVEPNNAETLSTRGQIYEDLGRNEEAIADYKAALAADPRLLSARFRLQKMGIAPPRTPARETFGEPVKGWVISKSASGHYLATNRRFPKLRVRLEMYGPGEPQIVDWTLMKYSLKGIGLLRYRAGALGGDGTRSYDYTAIIDLWKAKLVGVEPHSWGEKKARWDWKMASVTVTDPDGIANEVTLRKTPRDGYGEGGQFWFNDGWWSRDGWVQPRPQPRRRPPSNGGLFDWLFR